MPLGSLYFTYNQAVLERAQIQTLLPAIAILASLFWLWQQTFSHYDAMPLGLVGLVLGSLVFLMPQLPRILWAWWGLGLLSILWSLTPGNTLALGLWELAYLAAFAAGGWLVGFVGLNVVLQRCIARLWASNHPHAGLGWAGDVFFGLEPLRSGSPGHGADSVGDGVGVSLEVAAAEWNLARRSFVSRVTFGCSGSVFTLDDHNLSYGVAPLARGLCTLADWAGPGRSGSSRNGHRCYLAFFARPECIGTKSISNQASAGCSCRGQCR